MSRDCSQENSLVCGDQPDDIEMMTEAEEIEFEKRYADGLTATVFNIAEAELELQQQGWMQQNADDEFILSQKDE